MRILDFKISAQVLEPNGDFSDIVSGTSGYLVARFTFSEEWSKCKKIASFVNGGKEHAVILQNGRCLIPDEALTGKYFTVQVIGVRKDYKINTNKFIIYQKEE